MSDTLLGAIEVLLESGVAWFRIGEQRGMTRAVDDALWFHLELDRPTRLLKWLADTQEFTPAIEFCRREQADLYVTHPFAAQIIVGGIRRHSPV